MTISLTTLSFKDRATYLMSALFIIGNIVMPQLFHLIPNGGVTWLPIYFFTLIGSYIYGWRVGLLTALLSPVINSMFFAMPPVAALPAIMLKSTLLALIAGFTASRFRHTSLLLLIAVVLGYQVTGTLGEWIIKGDFFLACQDFRIGIPGMLLQIIGGYIILPRK